MPTVPEYQLLDVVVVGAGFAGICMAAQLQKEPGTSFVVLEKADAIGGTWRDNTYPGCACDVPSHLYSFSFALKSDWPRMYSAQPEIREYLEDCVDRLGLREKIRLGAAVTALKFDESAQLWNVSSSAGSYRARFVVGATGPLSQPALPSIEGMDRFAGKVFHSAQWNHTTDVQGLRVAVVGTGASAIQLIPELAKTAASLVVLQRTAPWVMSKGDRAIGPLERRLYHAVPFAARALRAFIYWRQEVMAIGFIRPQWMAYVEKMAVKYIAAQIPDAVLRDRVTPRYRLGCKRILISNDYYATLRRPNVTLVTDPIASITAEHIVVATGKAYPIDVLVYATGFRTSELLGSLSVRGRRGRSLGDAWHNAPHAYLGALVPDFPNLFFLLGPNTGLGHNSVVFMIEAQVSYVIACLRYLRRNRLSTVEVTARAESVYNANLQVALKATVWGSGCHSWYQNADGHNFSLWPGFSFSYWKRLRSFDRSALCFDQAASVQGKPT